VNREQILHPWPGMAARDYAALVARGERQSWTAGDVAALRRRVRLVRRPAARPARGIVRLHVPGGIVL
jgi:hypothetical protein